MSRINLVHLNIRSLVNKIDLFKTTFHDSNVHVLGLSETWLTNAIPDPLVEIPGYTIYRNDRMYNDHSGIHIKKGGGTCLFILDKLNGYVDEMENMSNSNEHVEGQWVELKLENEKNVIFIGNIYRPPQGNVKVFLDYLEECLEKLDYIHKDIVIMGDINIDFRDRKFDGTKELKEFLSQSGLTNHINTPTRFSTTKNSCLDHIYSNSNIINDSGTLDVNISDHLPVFINRKKAATIPDKVKFLGRSYGNYDSDIFANELSAQSWDVFDNTNDPNIMWNYKKHVRRLMFTNLHLYKIYPVEY